MPIANCTESHSSSPGEREMRYSTNAARKISAALSNTAESSELATDAFSFNSLIDVEAKDSNQCYRNRGLLATGRSMMFKRSKVSIRRLRPEQDQVAGR